MFEPTMSNAMSVPDHLDYISRRVSVSGIFGAVAGTFIAMYRGYDSIVRTSSRTAFSCAMVSTACFTIERCTYIGVTQYLLNEQEQIDLFHNSKQIYYLKLYTHTIGGILGGAMVGGLYTGKLLRGAFVFTPLMLFIAMTEEQVKYQLYQTMQHQNNERYQESQQESVTK
jgi:hypothetical protein